MDCSKEHEIAHNGPIASSPTLPFVKNTGVDNIPEDMVINGEEKVSNNTFDGSSDSFLQFLDAVKMPKEQLNKDHSNLQAEIFLATISKLVNSNSKLNDLLSAERKNNISLINENANLKLKSSNSKMEIAGRYPLTI